MGGCGWVLRGVGFLWGGRSFPQLVAARCHCAAAGLCVRSRTQLAKAHLPWNLKPCHAPRRITNQGKSYFLTYTADSAEEVATDYCKHKGYGGIGVMQPFTMPVGFAGEFRAISTVTMETCEGATCPIIGVVECVAADKQPLVKDANGNVGCGNSGGPRDSSKHVLKVCRGLKAMGSTR